MNSSKKTKIKKIMRKINKRIKELNKNKKEAGNSKEKAIELIIGKERINAFNERLKENNSKFKAEELIKWYGTIGASLSLLSIGISPLLQLNFTSSTLLFIFSLVFPGSIHYLYHAFLFEKNKREKEKLVPDVLLQASIFPKGTPTTKIIKYISEAEYGPITKEFSKALNEIEKGKTVEESLKDISKRCKSEIISRAMNLLIQGNKSGAEMNKVFKETAEDILETQGIIKERIASTFIQKYTLILAGGIIVPALLGLITGFVNEMNFIGISELGLGMQEEKRKTIIEAALTSNQIYIIEYALIAAFFISQQEGNTKKAIIYALILIPLGFISYNIALIL
jgi:pilus assembly protein TadC